MELVEKGKKITKIVYEDGQEIDLVNSNICHLVIVKESEKDGITQFGLSNGFNNRFEAISLSNQAFTISKTISIMEKEGLDFEEAFKLQNEMIQQIKKIMDDINNIK